MATMLKKLLCAGLATFALGYMMGTATATAPPGNPWPAVTPRATHHEVLLLGDSLAGGMAAQLQSEAAARGFSLTIDDQHVGGTNLIDPVGYFANAQDFDTYMIDHYPNADTVVVEYVGTCGGCAPPGQTPYDYGGSVFRAVWQSRAHAIIDYAMSHGRKALWAVSPPVGATWTEPAQSLWLNPSTAQGLAYADLIDYAPRTGNPGPSWWNALTTTSGTYSRTLNYDGADHSVRIADDVHLDTDGGTRAAVWTLSTFGSVWP